MNSTKEKDFLRMKDHSKEEEKKFKSYLRAFFLNLEVLLEKRKKVDNDKFFRRK
jgi:hypothetical protein